ncbi:MAG: hypothetical protein ACXACY_27415 [Candidatus Hodarchaeales archaeon]
MNEWTIVIDDEEYYIDEIVQYSYLPILRSGRLEFYVAENVEEAGKANREYWEDMAHNDPAEFTCIVGEETLIKWALGQSAGPGHIHVHSLDEWLDLVADYPEEQWASYDGTERDVDKCSEDIIDRLDFTPTVAYRHN